MKDTRYNHAEDPHLMVGGGKTRKSHVFRKGLTLIETLAFLFVFSVITLTFYQMFANGTTLVIESRMRLAATALASERMEIVHSLSYDRLGTQGGIPSGNLPQREEVVRGGKTYYVFTLVQYFDDSYDGKQGGSPNDTTPNDYKRVRVKVTWEDDVDSDKGTALIANFVPPKKETPAGGGTLAVNILDKDGHGVPSAEVTIVNSGKGVSISTVTDSQGSITFPAAPADSKKYAITASKSGYYGMHTYSSYPTTAFRPVDEHAAVTVGLLNTSSYVIEESVDLTLIARDPFGNDLPGIQFHLKGGRKIGDTVAAPVVPVYDLDTDYTSDTEGKNVLTDQSYGTYTYTLASGGRELLGIDIASTASNVFYAEPGSGIAAICTIVDTSLESALISVKASGDSSPIAGADVRLTNSTLGYDATVSSDTFGNAYFPTEMPELTAGNYDIAIAASNYQDKTDSLTVSTGLVKKTVQMNAQ